MRMLLKLPFLGGWVTSNANKENLSAPKDVMIYVVIYKNKKSECPCK